MVVLSGSAAATSCNMMIELVDILLEGTQSYMEPQQGTYKHPTSAAQQATQLRLSQQCAY